MYNVRIPVRLGHPVVPFLTLFCGRVPLKWTKPKKVGTLILASQICSWSSPLPKGPGADGLQLRLAEQRRAGGAEPHQRGVPDLRGPLARPWRGWAGRARRRRFSEALSEVEPVAFGGIFWRVSGVLEGVFGGWGFAGFLSEAVRFGSGFRLPTAPLRHLGGLFGPPCSEGFLLRGSPIFSQKVAKRPPPLSAIVVLLPPRRWSTSAACSSLARRRR